MLLKPTFAISPLFDQSNIANPRIQEWRNGGLIAKEQWTYYGGTFSPLFCLFWEKSDSWGNKHFYSISLCPIYQYIYHRKDFLSRFSQIICIKSLYIQFFYVILQRIDKFSPRHIVLNSFTITTIRYEKSIIWSYAHRDVRFMQQITGRKGKCLN